MPFRLNPTYFGNSLACVVLWCRPVSCLIASRAVTGRLKTGQCSGGCLSSKGWKGKEQAHRAPTQPQDANASAGCIGAVVTQ